jgi:hypothetical protein
MAWLLFGPDENQTQNQPIFLFLSSTQLSSLTTNIASPCDVIDRAEVCDRVPSEKVEKNGITPPLSPFRKTEWLNSSCSPASKVLSLYLGDWFDLE